jgi:tetratricopeptide (TPR) repeat protein
MTIKFATIPSLALAVSALAFCLPVQADFGPPKKKLDCTKAENKKKPECKPKAANASDDEIYHAAYWMAREGRYSEALEVLNLARDREDPRILNATGFATRKLGDVEGALPYYHRALARDPDYVLARAYLGEAYLSQGRLAQAKEQLGEIAKRCGTACAPHNYLATRIAQYEARGKG